MTNPDMLTLLSTYLDGELPPSQAARLEQRLTEDPQARRLLADLERTRQAVGALPRQQAPAELAQQIQLQLERESLLTSADAHAEIAGRNHLRLRRLVAAAAVLALTGAVAAIIYTVLSRPSATSLQPDQPAPVIALDRPAPTTNITRQKSATSTTPPPPTTAKATAAPTTAAAPQCSMVKLLIDSTDRRDARKLTAMLTGATGDQLIAKRFDDQRQQFIFVCAADQLPQIFIDLKYLLGHPIDIVVTDHRNQREILVQDATENQLMTIAAEPRSDIQFTHALDFQPDLPAWYRRAIARGPEPQLTDLRLLAPADPTAASPAAPPETLTPFLNQADPLTDDAPTPSATLVAVTILLRTPPLEEPNTPNLTNPPAPHHPITTTEAPDPNFMTLPPSTNPDTPSTHAL